MARASSARKPRGNSPMTTRWPGKSSRCFRSESNRSGAIPLSPRRFAPGALPCPPLRKPPSSDVSGEACFPQANGALRRSPVCFPRRITAAIASRFAQPDQSISARRVMGAWWPPRSSKPSSRHRVLGGVFDPLPLRQIYSRSGILDRPPWRQPGCTGLAF